MYTYNPNAGISFDFFLSNSNEIIFFSFILLLLLADKK